MATAPMAKQMKTPNFMQIERLVEERVRGLRRRDVDVDAAREGEEQALGAVAGLRREEHRRADEDGHAAQRVDEQRHALREAALRDQQEEVARLLREPCATVAAAIVQPLDWLQSRNARSR